MVTKRGAVRRGGRRRRRGAGRLVALARRHRRVGAAFAASFLTHVGLILWLYRVAPVIDAERPVPLAEVIGGIAGIALIYGMLATSFDRTAPALGTRRWRALHRWGGLYVMVVFLYCFLESFTRSTADLAAQAPAGLPPGLYYYPFTALAIGGVLLRAYAALAARSRRRAAAARRPARPSEA
jgi:sulfoxide reductase heme-binding subunit YedZ